MSRKIMQLSFGTLVVVALVVVAYLGASRVRQVIGKQNVEMKESATGMHTEFLLWELTGSTILNSNIAK
jgi:Sec-independent protein translocase protein TatA